MTKKQSFTIKGMHCTGCAANIDLDLEELEGIVETHTSYTSQKTTVTYDDQKTNEKTILDQIKKTGYTAIPVTSDA